jgi:hypothetical protein
MAQRALLVWAILAVAVATSSAQDSVQGTITSTVSRSGSFSGSAGFGPPPHFEPPAVTGAPYSGEEVNENLKILTDGTRIAHHTMTRKIWRDDLGRTRLERPLGMGANVDSMPVIVEITDPVAGFKYVLETQNKVAHRQALPAPGSRPAGFSGGSAAAMLPAPTLAPAPAPANARPRPRFSHESLGSQTVEGIFAEGTRNTITYPVGIEGNDREFSVVTETWTSPDLKVVILSKNNDPRNGENTFRIENLSRTPPDATLFSVPSDYTVVDEAGGFTIHFKSQ